MARRTSWLLLSGVAAFCALRLAAQDVELGPGIPDWRPVAALPEGVLDLTPRAAAEVILAANVEPWMQRALRAWIEEPQPGRQPPEAGWLTVTADDGSDRSQPFALRCVAFGPEPSSIEAWGALLSAARDEQRVGQLSRTSARWLAETVWWLGQARYQFHPDIGGLFAYTVTHDSILTVQLHGATQPDEPLVQLVASCRGFGLTGHQPAALITRPISKLVELIVAREAGSVERPRAWADTLRRIEQSPHVPPVPLLRFFLGSALAPGTAEWTRAERLLRRLPASVGERTLSDLAVRAEAGSPRANALQALRGNGRALSAPSR